VPTEIGDHHTELRQKFVSALLLRLPKQQSGHKLLPAQYSIHLNVSVPTYHEEELP
jgi:hypothetical protein